MSFFGDHIPAVHFPCGLDCQHVTFRASLPFIQFILPGTQGAGSQFSPGLVVCQSYSFPHPSPASCFSRSSLPFFLSLDLWHTIVATPPGTLSTPFLPGKRLSLIHLSQHLSSPTSLSLDSLPMMQCVFQSLNFSRCAFDPWPSSLLKFLLPIINFLRPIINFLFSAAPFPGHRTTI